MYDLFTYIWVVLGVNVGKYSSPIEHLGTCLTSLRDMFFFLLGFGVSASVGGVLLPTKLAEPPVGDPCSDSSISGISENHRSAPKMRISTSSPKNDDWRKPLIVHAASWWHRSDHIGLRDDLWMKLYELHDAYAIWCFLNDAIRYQKWSKWYLWECPFCFLMWWYVMGLSFKWAFLSIHFVSRKTTTFVELPKFKAFWKASPSHVYVYLRINFKRMNLIW